ncbi:hypothetical protein Lesp01_08320 [Lentzea sp. NBRC 102530]|nr:hypothetical protein Lesp01_08320 [Lentzea sp. NBRC 102530]
MPPGVVPAGGGESGVGLGAGGGVDADVCGGALLMVLSGVGALGASKTPFAPPPAPNLLPPRSPPVAPGAAPPIGGAIPGGAAGGVAPPRDGDVTAFCGPGALVDGLVPAAPPGSL